MNLIRDLDTDFSILGKNYVNVIQVSSHLFAMSSACYNPFIYASLHDKFLSYLCRHFLSRRRGKGKDRGQGSSILTMSHRVPRLHTSSIVADLPGTALNNIIHLDNYAWNVFQLNWHNDFTLVFLSAQLDCCIRYDIMRTHSKCESKSCLSSYCQTN